MILFSKKTAFPALKQLFLEDKCALTFWLKNQLQKARPALTILTSSSKNFF